jgi:ferredoxin
MRIGVDADLCTGHGRCYALAPDVYSYDDEGFVTLRGKEMDVPEGLETQARDGILACPEGAIFEVAAAPDQAGG